MGDEAAELAGRNRPSNEELSAWRQVLADGWTESETAAYLYLSVNCTFGAGPPADVAVMKARFAASPLVQYRAATCRDVDEAVLRAQLRVNPRFHEIAYFLGVLSVNATSSIDARRRADAYFDEAWERIPRLTAARVAAGELALGAEEYEEALAAADDVLGIVPEHRRARVLKLEALSHLGRHHDAIVLARELAGGVWYLGDVYYLLAWNELQVERIDEALAHVERARLYETRARTHILEGLLRMRQARWLDARGEFESALALESGSCDARFHLGETHERRAAWNEAANAFEAAMGCYGSLVRSLDEQIAAASNEPARDSGVERLSQRLRRKRARALERERSSLEHAVASFRLAGNPDRARELSSR